jgi:hypothetical protein
MYSRLDVVDAAFRRIGVRAEDQQLSADQLAFGGRILDAIIDEASAHMPLGIMGDLIPRDVFLPLETLLAVELAPSYAAPAPVSRGVAMARLRAILNAGNVPSETVPGTYF